MDKVIKGLMGYTPEKKDKPATHVVLSIAEYNNLIRKIRNAELMALNTENEAKNKLANYKKQANDLLHDTQMDAQKRVEGSQKRLNELTNEIARLNDLNANLLRISRERANSKRGLKPKKEHHGYIILDLQQYTYNFHYAEGRRNLSEDFPCWKVRIQTPYDSSIPFDDIHQNIKIDIVKHLWDSMKIKSFFDVKDCDINEFEDKYKHETNFIFKASYKANMKSGFWEVIFLTKNSINLV